MSPHVTFPALNRHTPLPKSNHLFTAGPTVPTPTVSANPTNTPATTSPFPSISSHSSRPRSPKALFFPADYCGPPKKPKPMPKFPKRSTRLEPPRQPTARPQTQPQAPYLTVSQTTTRPESPFLHVTHNRSVSNLSSQNDVEEVLSHSQNSPSQTSPVPDSPFLHAAHGRSVSNLNSQEDALSQTSTYPESPFLNAAHGRSVSNLSSQNDTEEVLSHSPSSVSPQPTSTRPEPPFLHVTHARSVSNLSSHGDIDATQNSVSRGAGPVRQLPVPPQPAAAPGYMSDSEDESTASMLRRRKMDKITRTFGEAVPAELLFPSLTKAEVLMEFRPPPQAAPAGKDSKDKEKQKQKKAGRRTSISISTLSSFASLTNFTTGLLPSSSPAAPPEGPAKHVISGKRVKQPANPSPRSSLQPSPLGFANSTESLGPGLPGERPDAPADWSDPKRPFGPRSIRGKTAEQFLEQFPHVRPTSPFYDAVKPAAPPLRLAPLDSLGESGYWETTFEGAGKAVTRTRTEQTQGWMGEWNRDDMADVIKQLRALK